MSLLSRELQRDVKTLRKVVEQMSTQMDSQAVRERPKIAALLEEVNVIKETMNIQVRLKLKWALISFGLIITGKYFIEAPILASTNPQYDKRLFMELS